MTERTLRSRIPLALCAWLAAGTFAAAAETPAVTPPVDEAGLWAEIAKEPVGNSGTYGQALSYLAKHSSDAARMDMLGDSLARKQDGRVSAGFIKTFLKDSSNRAASALLVDAGQNQGTGLGMREKYVLLKSSRVVGDFASFLNFLAKDPRGPETIHRILTGMSQPPTAPKGEGERREEDEAVQGRGRSTRAGRATQADIDRLNRSYWNADELYGKAGDPNVVSMGGRLIAFNIVSVKGADGKMTQKLTVYDRTDPQNVHGRSFELTDAALAQGLKFKMDDRPGAANPAEYSLQLVADAAGKDAKIVFQGAAGEATVPTVKDLFRMRAQKILDYGYVVKVGNKEYYVGGEGYADAGQNTFWDIEKLKRDIADPDFDPTGLVPEMAAVSVQMNKESKKFEPVGRSSIGQVDGKWYDLVWNQQNGFMDVVEGTAPPAGPQEGTVPAGEGADAKGWPLQLVPPRVGLALSKEHEDVKAINAQLDSAGLNARVYSFSPQQSLADQYWVVYKAGEGLLPMKAGFLLKGAGNSQFQGFELLGGSVLAVRDGAGTNYFDLKGIPQCFTPPFPFWDSKTKLFQLKDNEVAFRDAMKLAGMGADADAVWQRANSHGKPLSMFMYPDGKTIEAGYADGPPFEIWPNDRPSVGGGKPEDSQTPGTGYVLDPLGGGTQTGEMPRQILGKPTTVVSEGQGVALYEVKDGDKTEWHVIVTVTAPEGVKRYGPKLLFQDPPDSKIRFPGADKVNIRSITREEPAPEDAELKFGPRQDGQTPLEQKGIYAIWHGEKAGKWGNCLGVVAYWGMTSQEADDLCKKKQ